jgi:DNA-binding NarL/FixJ family response regulator
MSIQVAIVEDDREYRDELASVINATPGMRCSGAFGSCEEFLKSDFRTAALVLLDVNLPRMSGVQCVSTLRARGYSGPLLMLTVHEDPETLFASLQAGATGYLLKRSSLETIIDSIRTAHAGGSPMTPQIARRVVEFFHRHTSPNPQLQTLSPREHEVLEFLAKGHLYKQIASELHISIDTVRHHIRKIYEKLQVNSRTEAILKFVRR